MTRVLYSDTKEPPIVISGSLNKLRPEAAMQLLTPPIESCEFPRVPLSSRDFP